jgi:hypothetical protein
LFWWAFAGASCCLQSRGEDKDDVTGIIEENKITAAFFTPSQLSAFMSDIESKNSADRLKALLYAFSSGGTLTCRQAHQFNDLLFKTNGTRLTNMYGPPEAADSAADYFRALRTLNMGSLHIAHVTKAEGGDQKPFGSTFYHNGARSTWFVQRSEDSGDGRLVVERRLEAAAAQLVVAVVASDAQHPDVEPLCRVEACQRGEGPGEGLLGGIAGRVAVAHQPAAQPEDLALAAAHQLREGCAVAVRRSASERGFVPRPGIGVGEQGGQDRGEPEGLSGCGHPYISWGSARRYGGRVHRLRRTL